MAEGGRIELTADMPGDHITGRANLAGYPARRTYTCADCGGHGSSPTHTPAHHVAIYADRIRRSAPAAAARKASAELHAFLDATPLGDPGDAAESWLAEYMTLSGALHAATTEHLAELDREAGATT